MKAQSLLKRRLIFPVPSRRTLITATALVLMALGVALINTDKLGIDWLTFQAATLSLVLNGSPYTIDFFYNPPWILLPLIPIALLPPPFAYGLIYIANFFAYGYIAKKFGASPLAVLVFLLSPFVLEGARLGQIDFLAVLGVIMPPQIGLFFVLAKPQACGLIALYWFYTAWKSGRTREVFRVFAPVTVALLLSFAIYGLYPVNAMRLTTEAISWNYSAWPLSIPLGVAFLIAAFRNKRPNLAITASPMLSPYFNSYTLPAAFFGLLPRNFDFIAANLAAIIAAVFLM